MKKDFRSVSNNRELTDISKEIPADGYSSRNKTSDNRLWSQEGNLILPHIERSFARPRSLCAEDNRKEADIKNAPYQYICSLIITTGNGEQWEGTGFFISEHCVITAGHCVYSADRGGWAKSITVIPGRKGEVSPFGRQVSDNFHTVSGWLNDNDPDVDVGAIILPDNTLFNIIGGYFGYARLSDDIVPITTLNNSGYPDDKADAPGRQWFSAGRINSLTPYKFEYMIDTAGGSSGSPVYVEQGGKLYVVGVHAYGGCPNSAVRVSDDIFQKWKEWSDL